MNHEYFMKLAPWRHDISDHIWNLLEPHLPGWVGIWGGYAKDDRFIVREGSRSQFDNQQGKKAIDLAEDEKIKAAFRVKIITQPPWEIESILNVAW